MEGGGGMKNTRIAGAQEERRTCAKLTKLRYVFEQGATNSWISSPATFADAY